MIERTDAPRGGLGKAAVHGVAKSGLGQLARILLQIVSVVVLVRLLAPSDYGLFAMVTAVIGIGEIFREMGLSTASIRAESLSIAERDNLFWISTGLGAILMVLVAACAPLIALVYGRKELVWIALALAPTFLLSGLAAQYRAQLNRSLQFGALAIADTTSTAIALGAAIWGALCGLQYWALVVQALLGGFCTVFFYAAFGRWRPRRFDRSVDVSPMLKFGVTILGAQIITYLTINFDSMMIGGRLGAVDLGLYNRALQTVRTPMGMVHTPVSTVALPVLSRLQSDHERFLEFARRAQGAVAIPLIAGLAFVVATADRLIPLLLGRQWVGAVQVVQWIAIGEALSVVMYIASTMYVSFGLGKQLMTMSSFTLGLRIVTVLAALPFGLLGVAQAYALAPMIVFPFALLQVQRATGIKTGSLLIQGVVALAAGGVCGFVAYSATRSLVDGNIILYLAVTGAIGLACYALLGVVPYVRRQYVEIYGALRLFFRRGTQVGTDGRG